MRLQIKNCKACPLLGQELNKDGVISVWCNHPRTAQKKYDKYVIGGNVFRGFRIGVRKPPKQCPLYYCELELCVNR